MSFHQLHLKYNNLCQYCHVWNKYRFYGTVCMKFYMINATLRYIPLVGCSICCSQFQPTRSCICLHHLHIFMKNKLLIFNQWVQDQISYICRQFMYSASTCLRYCLNMTLNWNFSKNECWCCLKRSIIFQKRVKFTLFLLPRPSKNCSFFGHFVFVIFFSHKMVP